MSRSSSLLALPYGGSRGAGAGFRRERFVLGFACLIVTLSLWSYNQRHFVGDNLGSTIFTLTPKTTAYSSSSSLFATQWRQQKPKPSRVVLVERSLDDATKQALATTEFAICRATQLKAISSSSSKAKAETERFYSDIGLGTSCQNEPTYQAFTDELLWRASQDSTTASAAGTATGQQQQQQQLTSLFWGRRSRTVFPPHSNILMVGSKNAAQVAQIWACQIVSTMSSSSLIQSWQQQQQGDDDHQLVFTPIPSSVMTVDESSDRMVTHYTFPFVNGTLTVVADSYFAYANNDNSSSSNNNSNTGGANKHQEELWQILLEQQLQRAFAEIYPSQKQQEQFPLARLENMDALILGLFQECSAQDKTKFTKKMMQASQIYAPSVNCLKSSSSSNSSSSPLSITQWTKAMRHGTPIAFLTFPMTDKAHLASQYYWEMRQFMEQQSEQQQQSSPSPSQPLPLPVLGLIDARRFRNLLAETCPSHACKQGGGSTRRPCIGAYGSYTDTVVWDIVEFLYAHLQVTKPHPQTAENDDDVKNHDPAISTSASAFDVRPAFSSNHSSLSCPSTALSRPDRTMCRLPYIATPSNDRLAQPVRIHYQCTGPDYDAFGQNMQTYIDNKVAAAAENNLTLANTQAQQQELSSSASSPLTSFSSWGRRSLPIPSGKRVLIVGNSHTRQMAYAMLCMHADSIKGMVELGIGGANAGPMRFEFCHDAQIVTAFNSYFPYSQDWQSLLEMEVIKEPLENFDAVVVGLFNHCGGENSFTRDMMSKTADMPHVDCVNTAPPTMLEWAEAYPRGALIFVSMFANNLITDRDVAVQHIQQLRNKNSSSSNHTNVVHYVDGRQHIDTMHQECACPNRTHAEDCDELLDNPDPDYPAHRCVGEHGGHPDLVAWDVMEYLHSLLDY